MINWLLRCHHGHGELGIDLAIVFGGLALYFLAVLIDAIMNWNNPNAPGRIWINRE